METENVNVKNWKSLIKPTKLDVKISEDLTKATIIAEPLEKGYGLTLGNSLRRILLSSIRGAAVTSIQIDGVLHEFTSIKGVREDVTDIVLNVKSLALKSNSEGTKKLVLDAKGPGEIKASDISEVTDIETETSTDGGTSDGRFIAPIGAEVVELGPVNESIHKVNECIRSEDLITLSEIYNQILVRLLTKD